MNFSTAPFALSSAARTWDMPASPAALVTSSFNGSADSLDLNHGEATEKNKEAQHQREAAKYPRTDTDPGHH